MFSEPYTYWETVSPYWHNWPLPLFKHVPQLLWYNIFFFWFCLLSKSVLYLLLPLLPISVPSDSTFHHFLPLLSVPMSHPLAALQLGQMVPNLALLLPSSWWESRRSMILEQWWTAAQVLDKTVRQVTLIPVPHCPTPPLPFPLIPYNPLALQLSIQISSE